MIRKILPMIIIFISFNSLSAFEKMSHRHTVALGADKSFGEDYHGPASGVLFYSLYGAKEDGWFKKFQVSTVTAFVKSGYEDRENSFAYGLRINHSVYGAYTEYNQGIDNKETTYIGSNAGLETHYARVIPYKKWNELFSVKFRYYPAISFYNKNGSTDIEMPANHLVHNGEIELKFDMVEYKSLNRIKQGIFLKASYWYSHRTGWEDRVEPLTGEVSEFKSTHRFYGTAGFYHLLPVKGHINMQFDFLGSWQKNVDRANGEQLGSYIADFATMPGYYYGEFFHHSFFISKAQLGLPLGFWKGRVKPGFNILYMPADNRVIGKRDYPRKTYRSISLSTSLYLFDTLPFFVDYAYGMDAQRRVSETGEIKRGNHEIRAFFLFAYGERN